MVASGAWFSIKGEILAPEPRSARPEFQQNPEVISVFQARVVSRVSAVVAQLKRGMQDWLALVRLSEISVDTSPSPVVELTMDQLRESVCQR